MTNEQVKIDAMVAALIKSGNMQIIKRNSRSRSLPFGGRLARGISHVIPLALFFGIGYFATHVVFKVIEWVML